VDPTYMILIIVGIGKIKDGAKLVNSTKKVVIVMVVNHEKYVSIVMNGKIYVFVKVIVVKYAMNIQTNTTSIMK